MLGIMCNREDAHSRPGAGRPAEFKSDLRRDQEADILTRRHSMVRGDRMMAKVGSTVPFNIAGKPFPARSVSWPGRRFVFELLDSNRNAAPGHRAVVIAAGFQLVSTRGAFLERLLAVALEHQVGGAPDIDFWYHAELQPRQGVRQKVVGE